MACLEITDKILTDNELIDLYRVTKDSYFLLDLYNRYERLLNKIAFKYSNINSLYSYEDLKSETYISLVKATEMYNSDRATFTTFLFTVVNQILYTVVNGKSSKDKYNNDLYKKQLSIYQTLTDTDDDCMLIDTIEDEVAQEMIDNLPEIMFITDLRRVEEEAISKLSPKQKLVVEAINGFNSEIYKEVELATYMNVSPARINEIKNNAYRKLRHNKELREIFFEEFIKY